MRGTRNQMVGAVVLAVLGAFALTGCEKVSASNGGSGGARTIDIDGSSTTVLLTEAVTHEFRDVDAGVSVSLAVSGTGGGFKRFCVGETDISDASRPITQSEAARAKASGVEFVELPVAFDGVTIAVHKDNTWVDHLTVAELNHIFREADAAKTWAQVRAGWPDRPIALWGPGTASGTFDYFEEVVFPDKSPMRNGDISMSEDDHILVRGIAGDRDALGFFGFAYYEANQDKLRAVPIDSGDGPVAPSTESIRDGQYRPFSRPLFIYVNARSLEKPHVRSFVDFYLDHAGALASEVKYVPVPSGMYAVGRALVASGTTGTRWLDAEGAHVHAPLTALYPEAFGTGAVAGATEETGTRTQ